MPEPGRSVGRGVLALFGLYVAATVAHIAYVVAHEPFAFDAWNVAQDTGGKPFTVGRFFQFWGSQYTTSNPRIGQPLTYLCYKLVGFAEVGTPLAYLAIVGAAFVLGTRRWPSWRSGRDLATLAIGLGFLWFAAPQIGMILFCRAYATNYVWACAIQLWFLVPLRLYRRGDASPGALRLAAFALLGVAAGMCNEHTGPTLVLAVLGLTVWHWRALRAIPALPAVGSVGAIVGFALVFFAPGQGSRYDGLATRMSLSDRIISRGFTGNLDIFEDWLYAAGPLLVLLVAVLVARGLRDRGEGAPADGVELEARREAARMVLMALAAGALITATVFVSPKLGPRFYLHSMALLLAGFLGVVASHVQARRVWVPLLVLAGLSSTYAAARTIPLFTRLARQSEARLIDLQAAPAGSIVTAEAWEVVPESWWFLGDDFRDQKKREMVATYFGLRRVVFRGPSQWGALGASDVNLTYRYTFADCPECADEIDRLPLTPLIGADVAALHRTILDNVALINAEVDEPATAVEVLVNFIGSQPPLPAPRLYLGRWHAGALDGFTAQIARRGRSTVRSIVVDPALAKAPWDIYIGVVGQPFRLLGSSTSGGELTYTPWHTGSYWVLACHPEQCFVVAATKHRV